MNLIGKKQKKHKTKIRKIRKGILELLDIDIL